MCCRSAQVPPPTTTSLDCNPVEMRTDVGAAAAQPFDGGHVMLLPGAGYIQHVTRLQASWTSPACAPQFVYRFLSASGLFLSFVYSGRFVCFLVHRVSFDSKPPKWCRLKCESYVSGLFFFSFLCRWSSRLNCDGTTQVVRHAMRY